LLRSARASATDAELAREFLGIRAAHTVAGDWSGPHF
jgi:hypothetical protein